MKIKNKTNRKSRIDMLPLIDVIFLLLIFFIYAMLSMAIHKGLKLDLPKAGNLTIEKKIVLAVSVKKDGSVYINKKKSSLAFLESELKKEWTNKKNKEVLLFADKDISYQKLFNVLEKINFAGFTKISLQAESN